MNRYECKSDRLANLLSFLDMIEKKPEYSRIEILFKYNDENSRKKEHRLDIGLLNFLFKGNLIKLLRKEISKDKLYYDDLIKCLSDNECQRE